MKNEYANIITYLYSYTYLMTSNIKQKIGQLIMMDFRFWGLDNSQNQKPFTQANNDVCELFNKYNLGSFILFRENIVSNEQTISLLRDLQASVTTPLLFGVDQEGGRVNRLQQGTSTCGNMAVCATNNPDNATKLAKLIGDEIYSLGININFAPTVDVNSNPNNPIIGVRAFSDNTKTVTAFAKSAIAGYKQANIIPCLKHFPGHGNTAADTHMGVVTINSDIDELDNTELYPYYQICPNNDDIVMTAHISVPALDDTKFISVHGETCIPASLSHKITTELLKNKMQFKGLVITDAMDMKAISTNFTNTEAIVKTILAGTDIAMMPVRIWSADEIYKLDNLFVNLENEYKTNQIFADRVDESYDKIIKFKKDKNLDKSPIFAMTKDEQIKYANSIVGCAEHKKLELDITKQSTTFVKNNGLMPYSFHNKKILIVDSDNARLESFAKYTKQIANEHACTVNVITNNIVDDATDNIKNADIVLIVSESLREHSNTYSHINKLAIGKSINIAALTPYDINYMDNVENYVCIYGATSMDQTNYKKTTLEINILTGLMTIFAGENGEIINKAVGVLPIQLL